MHLPQHQLLLRDHKLHGGIDAVMLIIANENPSALRPEAIEEIRAKQRQGLANHAPAAVA